MQKSTSKEDFIKTVTPYATKASAKTGVPVSWIVAQWAHETGYGTNQDTAINNLAGLNHPSNAESGTGYKNLDEFASAYADFIQGKSYIDNGVFKAKNVTQFAQALRNGGYAEDKNYAYSPTWTEASKLTEDMLFNGSVPNTPKDSNGDYLPNGGESETEKDNTYFGKAMAKIDDAFNGIKLGFFELLIFGVVMFLMYETFIQNTAIDSQIQAVKKVARKAVVKSAN